MLSTLIFASLEEFVKIIIVIPFRKIHYGLGSILIFYFIEILSKYFETVDHLLSISPRWEYAYVALISFLISSPILHIVTSYMYFYSKKFMILGIFCSVVHSLYNWHVDNMPTVSYIGYATLGWIHAFIYSTILILFYAVYKKFIQGSKIDLF